MTLTPTISAFKSSPDRGRGLARGEARPAYQRAFADQLAIYKATQGE